GGRPALGLPQRTALHRAAERGELRVHYQPVVDLVSGRAQSVEALVRWEHDGRLLPPAAFVPFAEESGLVVPIGAWVLQAACRQVAAWSREPGEPALRELGLAVNVSMVQLRTPLLVGEVAQALRESGLPPARLT
ncbi:EAL domain-containing protein, partial [Acinetobacter baumannii]|uniref:EAL domain-containing protein n=1 Tax=Acinetobacter baumannii TaxID=470 RepID=UPI00352618D5